jgi:hypothetical protein
MPRPDTPRLRADTNDEFPGPLNTAAIAQSWETPPPTDAVLASRVTPPRIFSLITAVDVVWPLAGEHAELRLLQGNADDDGVVYPTEHPSDYPVVWGTLLRALPSLHRLRIDALAVRPPLQAVLSQREPVDKRLLPTDELVFLHPSPRHGAIWIPDSVFGKILQIIDHGCVPGQDGRGVERFYQSLQSDSKTVGCWVNSREDIGKIASCFDPNDEYWR